MGMYTQHAKLLHSATTHVHVTHCVAVVFVELTAQQIWI